MRFGVAFLLAYLSNVFCQTQPPLVQMEPDRPITPPSGWVLGPCPPTDSIVQARLVFQYSNGYDELAATVQDISNPCSPNYGKWLTLDQVNRMTTTQTWQISTVQEYLKSYDVDCHNQTLETSAITFTATVEKMQQVLHTTFETYISTRNETKGKQVVRMSGPYYLPADVAGAVLFEGAASVFPLDGYYSTGDEDYSYGVAMWPGLIEAKVKQLQRGNWNTSSCGNICQGLWTPRDLRQRYHISVVTKNNTNASLGVAVTSFGSQYFNPNDLNTFADECDEFVNATSMNYNDPSWCTQGWGQCSEAATDIELVAALTQPTYDIVQVFDNNIEFYQWATAINQLENPPAVISVSYGSNESASSIAYKQAVNFELLKMAARGITVLFASGDAGAYGIPGNPSSPVFGTPVFPASSPWITSVGGTALAEPEYDAPEVCSKYSGGGFSKTFPLPFYQSNSIPNYVSNLNPSRTVSTTQSYYRGYPDLSALYGNDVPYCIYNYKWGKNGGTSASTPVVASMIALLNQIRANVNGPRLGFINPWLYWLADNFPEVFNDVQVGQNNAWLVNGTGYPSVRGWDACTGLGTIRFDIIRQVIEHYELNGKPQCNATHPPLTPPPPPPPPTTTTPPPTTTTTPPPTTTTTPPPTTTTRNYYGGYYGGSPTTTPTPTTTTTPPTTTPRPTTTTPRPTTTTTPIPITVARRSYVGVPTADSVGHLKARVFNSLKDVKTQNIDDEGSIVDPSDYLMKAQVFSTLDKGKKKVG